MANLKEQILQVLNGNTASNSVSKIISNFQSNLLKNHSNPVFNQDDKNKILNGYSLLQRLGESLYRYNKLNQSDFDTQAEKSNVEKVLESGISNAKYIWHSEKGEHTCEKCRALDGKVFEFYDEVPERPHPNCRCYVEVIEEGNDNPSEENKEEEPFDCINKLLYWQKECQNACIEVENLTQEAEDTKLILEEFIEYLLNYSNDNIVEYANELYNLIHDFAIEICDMISQIIKTLQIFYKNWNELRSLSEEIGHYVDYSAEYYHTKANCEAAQLGDVGEKVATILGYARECGDIIKELLFKHQTLEQAFEHSIHDLEVNEKGRRLGKENQEANPKDIIPTPNDLLKEYW